MIASPNYVRFVYDGDGSDTPTAGPPGSAQIEDVFNDYFDSIGLAHDPTAFDGRSDYGPFIANGVPGRRSLHRGRGHQDSGAGSASTVARPAWPTTTATTRLATRSTT